MRSCLLILFFYRGQLTVDKEMQSCLWVYIYKKMLCVVVCIESGEHKNIFRERA